MPNRAKVTKEDKIRLIRAQRSFQDYQLLADQMGINRSTARTIISRAMELDEPENFIEKSRGGMRPPKVEEMRLEVQNILERNSAVTIKNMNSELRRRHPQKPTISDSHLARVCHGMFYTLKKLETSPFDRNRQDVKEERREYASWFLEEASFSPRIVYIDEPGFNVWT